MTTPEYVGVEFRATDGGSAPLTWGQRSIWKPLQEYGTDSHYFNDSRVLDLGATCDLPRVLAAWRCVVERHQILRTRFYSGPAGMEQRTERSGTFPVLVQHTGNPAKAAYRLAEQLTARTFPLIDAWQVRLAIVVDDATTHRTPIHAVIVVSHLAIDGWAMEVLLDDFRRTLAAPDGAMTAIEWGPLEQARYEQSRPGRERSDEALAFWLDRLTAAPPSTSRLSAICPEEPRYHRMNLDSVAVAAASELLSAACRTSVSAVLLAATTLAVAALTDRPTCVLQLIAGNRFESRRRHTLENAAQNALFVFPIESADVAGLVQEVYLSSLAAYLHGCYDPVALDELVVQVTRDRGDEVDLSWYFNDAREGSDRWEEVDVAGMTESQLRRLTAETELYPSGTWQHQDCTFFLHVNRLPGRCQLQLLADTAVIPPKSMAWVLSGIESLLVRAAFHPVPVHDPIEALDRALPVSDRRDG